MNAPFHPVPVVFIDPPAQAEPPAVPMHELVEQYRSAKQRKSDLAVTHKEEMAPIDTLLAELQAQILATLQANGTTSMRTNSGQAVMVQRHSFSVEDPVLFRAWLAENPHGINLMANSVSKESLEAYINDGNTLPPGIKNSSVIGLRVNK